MVPRFIDLAPATPGGPSGWVYECTNEDLPTLRALTSHATRGGWFARKPKKIASISSGGEVPLTILLPAVKAELVAVDHNVGSLAWAMFKAHLLDHHKTVESFKKWLTSVTPTEFQSALDAFVATVVPAIPANSAYWWFSYRLDENLNMIRKQWLATPNKLLRKTKERLDLITFIHGDLRDIAPYGPFDLFYVSNAMAHLSKTGSMIPGDDLKPLMTANGKVIATHDLTPLNGMVQYDQLTDWKPLKFVKIANPTTRWGNISWNYNLYQKPAAETAASGG